ncbi:hypothetical protein CcaCcLH18_12840 [Colletotrichum camelliae]|nr:hypothetical protein CcaCcLH18_12840 [Colletotrichum camelliae]
MVPFLNLPLYVIVMVCDEIHGARDLCRLASTHRIFSYASHRLRKLYTAQFIYRTVWKEHAFTDASHEAADGVLELVHQMSPAQANTRLDIRGPLMKPPKHVGGKAQRHGDETTRYTCTLLHLACYSGLDNHVELLLACGADKEEDIHLKSILEEHAPTTQTPIEIAASRRHVHIMRRLAQAGAQINLRCAHWAIHYNSLPMIQLLFEFETQLSEDSTPLEWLYYATVSRRDQEDRTTLVEYLLKQSEHQGEAAVAEEDNRRFLFRMSLCSHAFPMALALAENGFATTVDDVQEVCRHLPDSDKEEDELLEILRYLLGRLRVQGTWEEYLISPLSLWRTREGWDARLREVIRAETKWMSGSQLAIIE